MSVVVIALLLLVVALGALVVFLGFAIDECTAENERLRGLVGSLLDERAAARIQAAAARVQSAVHPAFPAPRRFNR